MKIATYKIHKFITVLEISSNVVRTNTNTRCCCYHHSILEVPDTSAALFIVMSNEHAHVYDNAIKQMYTPAK